MYLLVCVHVCCVYGRVCNCVLVAVVHQYSACLNPHYLSVTSADILYRPDCFLNPSCSYSSNIVYTHNNI